MTHSLLFNISDPFRAYTPRVTTRILIWYLRQCLHGIHRILPRQRGARLTVWIHRSCNAENHILTLNDRLPHWIGLDDLTTIQLDQIRQSTSFVTPIA